ncbi:hypothetical protein KKF38_03565 [Patescibacteria group bacterium]|nr:hypothetical protein [Patescibacteria group bacterium]
MSKKILLTLIACTLVFTSGCGETTPDPQELLRKAFENALSINSATFSASGNTRIENVENTNGEVKFTFEGKGEDILKFPPKIDYSVGAEFNLQNPEEGNVTGSGKFSIKMLDILDDSIFAKFELTELAGKPELEAAKPFIQMFSGKWYKFSLKNLGINPEIEAAFVEKQEHQQKFIEFCKKLLSENDLLLAKNLREDGEDFVIEVEPNFDLILSEKFLDDTRASLLKLVKEVDENAPGPPEFDDEMRAELPEIRETAKKVWQVSNFKLTMKIGKENQIAHTSVVSGNLDLAEIAKIVPEMKLECSQWQIDEGVCEPRELSGKIIFDFTSTSSNFNQPQNITPPEDFIDFAPAMILGGMQLSPPISESENEDFLLEIPSSELGEMSQPNLELEEFGLPPNLEFDEPTSPPSLEPEEAPVEKNQPIARPR